MNNISTTINETWLGGYKLTSTIESPVSDLRFFLPGNANIRAIYGAELNDLGEGNYLLSSENSFQASEIIFIIDDSSDNPALPQFDLSNPAEINDRGMRSATSPAFSRRGMADISNELYTYDDSNSNLIIGENTDVSSENIDTQASDDNYIDVDADFNGNIDEAIAAASDGDTVSLGDNVYQTMGLTIDKNISLLGSDSSTIDGQGTNSPIIKFGENADNSIIRDLKLTNASTAIYGDRSNNLVLENLDIYDIGLNSSEKNDFSAAGVVLNHADGLELTNSRISNIGKKGVGIGDTNGATIKGLDISNINLAAQHSQSHDAAGIKLFNTNDVVITDNKLADINANFIWNDTSNKTQINNNQTINVGEDFLAPSFNNNVDINGIYNEKSSNSSVSGNYGTSAEGFATFNTTEFSTDTLSIDNNNFSSTELDTQDYWVNAEAEKLVAVTEDPDSANFELFADEYLATAIF